MYYPDGDSMVIIASAGGATKHPDWYHNLVARDRTEVEVGAETFPVHVDEVDGDERSELWQRIGTVMPGFAEYEKTANRVIPLLRLTRAA